MSLESSKKVKSPNAAIRITLDSAKKVICKLLSTFSLNVLYDIAITVIWENLHLTR